MVSGLASVGASFSQSRSETCLPDTRYFCPCRPFGEGADCTFFTLVSFITNSSNRRRLTRRDADIADRQLLQGARLCRRDAYKPVRRQASPIPQSAERQAPIRAVEWSGCG